MEKKKVLILALSALLVLLIIFAGVLTAWGPNGNNDSNAIQTDPVIETHPSNVDEPTQEPTEIAETEPTAEVLETESVDDVINENIDNPVDIEAEAGENKDLDQGVVNENIEMSSGNTDVGRDRIIVIGELSPNAEEDYPDDGYVVYTTHWVNVRSKPSMNGEIIGKIEEGERVFRYDTADGWSRIYYNGGVAYIANKYINSAKVEAVDVYSDVSETVYSGHDVNIRLAPSTKSPSIGKLKQGDSVRRIGVGKNGWSQVIYNNQLYYINSRYLSTDPNFKIPLEWFLEEGKEIEPTEGVESEWSDTGSGGTVNDTTNNATETTTPTATEPVIDNTTATEASTNTEKKTED